MRNGLIGALILSLAALAPRPGLAQGVEKLTLATAGKTLFNYLPVTLADRMGAFKDEGLSVEISDFPGGQKSIESVVAGSVDLAVGSYDNTLFLQPKGIDLTDITLINYSIGIVIGLNKAKAASYKGPQDLKGLKFGVSSPGSATHRALLLLLEKGGLGKNDVSVVGVGGGAGAVATIEAGELDGFAHSDPVAAKVLADGAMVPLVDTRTAQGMKDLYGGYIAATVVLTKPDFVKNRPRAAQKFVNAMVRALKWMHTAPLDDIIAIVPPEYYGADKELYRRSLAAQIEIFSADGITPPDAVQRTYAMASGQGLVPKGQQVDLAQTFDNSLAQKAGASAH